MLSNVWALRGTDSMIAIRTTERSSSLPGSGESMLVEGAAREVMTDVTKFFPKERLQHEAVRDERTRLARDLHDGVLQGLTGAALQLEAAAGLIAKDPDAARACVQAVGNLIASEQRELRLLIQKLKPAAADLLASVSELGAMLEQLCDRIGQQWPLQIGQQRPLRIQLVINGRGGIPKTLGDNVYRIVQEGLANVARHARAQVAHVVVGILSDKVCISVRDDGCGFPFHGRYDLAALIARELGPNSLRERVAALGGELILNSSLMGSSLEITLPFSQDALF
jgi:signal transduction histidine kinase